MARSVAVATGLLLAILAGTSAASAAPGPGYLILFCDAGNGYYLISGNPLWGYPVVGGNDDLVPNSQCLTEYCVPGGTPLDARCLAICLVPETEPLFRCP